MDQQTLMTLVGCGSFALVLLGYLGTMKRDLTTTIGKIEYRLKTKIDDVHIKLKTDIGKVEDRLTAIESRTYDISTRLPPAPASTSR